MTFPSEKGIQAPPERRAPLWMYALPLLLTAVIICSFPRPLRVGTVENRQFSLFLYYYPPGEAAQGAAVVSLEAAPRTFGKVLGITNAAFRRGLELRLNGNRLGPEILDEVRAPAEQVLVFKPGTRYRSLFRLHADAINPGDTLDAAFGHGQIALRSLPHRALKRPAEEYEKLENDALVASVLGQAAQLQVVAQRLSSLKPESASGYWYLGLAADMTGNSDAAREFYRESAIRLKPKEGEVPPYLILKRYAALAEAEKTGPE